MAATQPGKESQQASKQKAWQHLRSGLAIGAMTALCGGFLWMLYAPQEKTPGNEMFEGFDTSIPDATVSEMNADKRKVYEEIHRQELWQDKVRSLEDFSEDTLLSDSMTRIETSPTPGAGASAIDASHDTYRTLNRQIASFYRPTPAEDPRVADLQRQVEELTDGAIPGSAMKHSLSIGVAVSVGLAMIRVLTGISIFYLLVPGYAVAIALSFFVPKLFTAIAFDSGGVASGPMATTFLLPFAMGACSAVGGNIVTDAFGVVAMVAMTPLITIQGLGLIYRLRTKHGAVAPAPAVSGDAFALDDLAIIDL